MVIPVQACTRQGKPGYKYGQSGHCYTYERGNEKARKRAKQQAYIQGAAIETSTGESELKKEDYQLSYDEIVLDEIEKYNHNHGYRGRFTSSGGGGGGGSVTAPAAGGASSDLPSWMQEKPGKTIAPAAAEPAKPTQPAKTPPPGTFLPDSKGNYPYPDNAHARMDLKPLVGQEVKMEYWAENIGGRALSGTAEKTRCIKDIKVEGVKAPIHHVWAQTPSKELLRAPYGQKQEAIGIVTAYAKGKRGEGRTMDYSVQPIRGTINKEMPRLDADEILRKFEHLLEKYNHNHGDHGRFTSSGGGGGSAVSPAGGVQSLDDALAGKPIEENLNEPMRYNLEDTKIIKTVDDSIGVPQEQMLEMTRQVDDIGAKMGLKTLDNVQFKELDTNVLMQCEGQWKGKESKISIAINPKARDYATGRYVEDHMKLQQTNQMPWLASAHASDSNAAYKAVMVHEVGHGALMEHVVKQPTSQWINEHNPMYGDKKWLDTIHTAHAAGWQGVSQYSRKNPGEMFAECLSFLTIKSSTGNKDVDNYVLGVVGHA